MVGLSNGLTAVKSMCGEFADTMDDEDDDLEKN